VIGVLPANRARPAGDRSLSWYAHFVRRHAPLMVACAILGVAVGNRLVQETTPVYRAATRVVVSLLPTAAETVGQNVSVDSDAQVLTSTRVLHAAAQGIAYPGGAENLREHVGVRALPNSRVLELLVTDTVPSRAKEAAGAITTEYLRIRQATADARLEETRAALRADIDELTAQIAGVLQVAPTGQTSRRELVGEHRALVTELEERQRTSAELAGKQGPAGFVAEPPTLPDDGFRPSAESTRAAGGLLGLVVGSILSGVFDRRSKAATSPAGTAMALRRRVSAGGAETEDLPT
jgi:hypothetical protein